MIKQGTRTCVDKFLALLNTLLPAFFFSSLGVQFRLKASHGIVLLRKSLILDRREFIPITVNDWEVLVTLQSLLDC